MPLVAAGIDRADNLLKAIEREIIQTLPESEPLALWEIRGPVERPAHQLIGHGVKGRCLTHKKIGRFAAVSKGKKVKNQQEKASLTAKTQPPQHNETRHYRDENQG